MLESQNLQGKMPSKMCLQKLNQYLFGSVSYVKPDTNPYEIDLQSKLRESLKKSDMWRHKNERLSISFLEGFFPTSPLISLIFITSHWATFSILDVEGVFCLVSQNPSPFLIFFQCLADSNSKLYFNVISIGLFQHT